MQIDVRKLARGRHLTDAETSVLSYMIEYGAEEARRVGVRAIAAANFTSTATVMRLAKKLGYHGFVDMCYGLSRLSGRGEVSWGTIDDGNRLVLTFPPQNAVAIDAVAHRLHHIHGIVFIYACGYSSLLAQYLSKKLLGIGVRVVFSSADDSISIFENNLDQTDMLIEVSRSGRTPRVLKRLEIAADEGIFSVVFTGERESPAHDVADFAILAEDEEPLDDLNIDMTLFYVRTMALMELLVKRYADLLTA